MTSPRLADGGTRSLAARGARALAMLLLLAACGAGPSVEPDAEPVAEPALPTSSAASAALTGGGATQWAKQLGGAGEDMGLNVAYDPNGNLLVTVMYTHALDLGGAPLPAPAPNARCFAVAKLRPDGAHVWSRGFCATQAAPGESDAYALSYALGVDRWGNLMLGGRHSGGLNLGGGPLPAGNFVAKLSNAGAHVWSRPILSGNAAFRIDALKADRQGDFAALVQYRADAYDATQPTRIYLIKYRGNDGRPAWGQLFEHPAGQSEGWGLFVDDADDLYLAGGFRGTVSFGGPSLTAQRDTPFFARFSPSGAHLSSRSLPVTGTGFASSIVARGSRVIVGGTSNGFRFRGKDFDAGAFLMAFDAGGQEEWARSFTGAPPNLAAGWHNELLAYGDGAPWELGLSPPPVAGQPPPEPPGANFYVAKLDRSVGGLLWARGFHGTRYFFTTPPSVGNVAVDYAGDAAVVGSFAGPVDFGQGVFTPPDDSTDGFLVKLAP